MPRLISNDSLFTTKLQQILENQSMKSILRWGDNKHTIEIYDKNALIEKILPRYFRHNRFESFVRQMNLYGFKKIRTSGKHSFINIELKHGKRLTELKSKNQMKRQGNLKLITQSAGKNQQLSEQDCCEIQSDSQKNIYQIQANFDQIYYQDQIYYNNGNFLDNNRVMYPNYYLNSNIYFQQNPYTTFSYSFYSQQ